MSLATQDRTTRRADAVQVLGERTHRGDASQVVARLDDGLTQLRNLLLTRITEDVERSFGVDSMIVPLSQARTEHAAKGEIEALLVTEVADEASLGGLVALPAEWIRPWLLDLRLTGRQDRPL